MELDRKHYPNGMPRVPEDDKKKHNYKLIVDPMLHRGAQKIYRFDGVEPADNTLVHVKDPRPRYLRFWSKRNPADLPVPKFKVDQYYVGTPPPLEVTFTNLNDNINNDFLENMCKGFGKIDEVKVYFNPKTKKHMGIGKVLFTSSKAARQCVDKLNSTSKMGNIINVFIDTLGKERQRLINEVLEGKPKMLRPPSPSFDPRGRSLSFASTSSGFDLAANNTSAEFEMDAYDPEAYEPAMNELDFTKQENTVFPPHNFGQTPSDYTESGYFSGTPMSETYGQNQHQNNSNQFDMSYNNRGKFHFGSSTHQIGRNQTPNHPPGTPGSFNPPTPSPFSSSGNLTPQTSQPPPLPPETQDHTPSFFRPSDGRDRDRLGRNRNEERDNSRYRDRDWKSRNSDWNRNRDYQRGNSHDSGWNKQRDSEWRRSQDSDSNRSYSQDCGYERGDRNRHKDKDKFRTSRDWEREDRNRDREKEKERDTDRELGRNREKQDKIQTRDKILDVEKSKKEKTPTKMSTDDEPRSMSLESRIQSLLQGSGLVEDLGSPQVSKPIKHEPKVSPPPMKRQTSHPSSIPSLPSDSDEDSRKSTGTPGYNMKTMHIKAEPQIPDNFHPTPIYGSVAQDRAYQTNSSGNFPMEPTNNFDFGRNSVHTWPAQNEIQNLQSSIGQEDEDDHMSLDSTGSGVEETTIEVNPPMGPMGNLSDSRLMNVSNHFGNQWQQPTSQNAFLNNYQNQISQGNNVNNFSNFLGSTFNQNFCDQYSSFIPSQSLSGSPNFQQGNVQQQGDTDPYCGTFVSVLDNFVKELKHIIHRDLCKKMVENSAFKTYEGWWDSEEHKTKPQKSTQQTQQSKPDNGKKISVDNKTDISPALASLFERPQHPWSREGEINILAGFGGMGGGGFLGIRGGMPRMPSFKKKFQSPMKEKGDKEEEESEKKDEKEEDEEDESGKVILC
ncbi:hypothetical protein CHS0354_034716 [Potamilus streckersoni]|uniref:RRM domain-containing protein n=1 Tax=Potamilus streckersoni TaxID=2493646 RepID=A0AAE0SIM9_9BIVA|nr:hypothetical protein CHS0354_034716 [Potamilus streckersoni]